jgi:leader peptidase (prepilin peptidase) / N-methyltransferase
MSWVAAAVLLLIGIPLALLANREADRRAAAGARRLIPHRRDALVVAMPLALAACGLVWGVHPRAAVAAGFCAVLIALAAIDVEQHIVPNRIVLPAAAIVLVAQTAIEPSAEWAIAAFAAALFYFVAAIAYPGGLGMGDVKLALLLGAMLGRGVAAAVAIGMVSALIPSVVILARLGSRGRKTAIPLVPFLALGGVIALFVGRAIVDAYVGSL